MTGGARGFLGPREAAIVRLVLAVTTVVVLWLAISSVRNDSATPDEPAHIASGYVKMRDGRLDFYVPQPPLMNSISAIPLMFVRPHFEPDWSRTEHWNGFLFLYASGNDADRLLFLARLPTIALFIALCFVVFGWVHDATGNRIAALAAFLLTAFCPNLLAHGRLATVDLGLAFFMTCAAWTCLRALEKPTIPRLALCGAMTACTVMTKVSGLIVLPYIGALFVLYFVAQRKFDGRTLARFAGRLAIVLIAAFATFEVFYLSEIGDAYVATNYPGVSAAGRLAIPVLEYAKSVEIVQRWVQGVYDSPMFLLGEYSLTGWWYYFFVAFALKTPIGSQILFLFAIAVAMASSPRLARGALADRQLIHLLSALLLIALFFAATTRSNIGLGIRYVLTVYPFVYVSIGISLAMVAARFERRHAVVVALLIAWSAGSTARAHPSYISYFNELVPADSADEYLIDSNLDWGQDLKRLAQWAEANRIPRIYLDYFGGGEPGYYLGRRVVRWPAPNPRPLPRGWFAVSRHFYRISFHTREFGMNDDEYLRNAKFVTRIGGSIDVYWNEK